MKQNTTVVAFKHRLVEIQSGDLRLELMTRARTTDEWQYPEGKALYLSGAREYFSSLGATRIGGVDAKLEVPANSLSIFEEIGRTPSLWERYLEESIRRQVKQGLLEGYRSPACLTLEQLESWSYEVSATRRIDGGVKLPKKDYRIDFLREHRAIVPPVVMNGILRGALLKEALNNELAQIRFVGSQADVSRADALAVLFS